MLANTNKCHVCLSSTYWTCSCLNITFYPLKVDTEFCMCTSNPYICPSELYISTKEGQENTGVWLLWRECTEHEQCTLSGQENWWQHISASCTCSGEEVTLLLGTVERRWLKQKMTKHYYSTADTFKQDTPDSSTTSTRSTARLYLSLFALFAS